MIAATEKTTAEAADGHANVATASKRVAKRFLVILENRVEIALLELQEEREKVLHSLLYAMAAVACALLAGFTVTVIVAVAFWGNHPIAALSALVAIYLSVAVIFYSRLRKLRRKWELLPSTIEQLRKDRECLGKNLS
ncbi:MAG TPA: phage holin family protein [Pyrinomonadaceae bacterium]|nr:phage holin family protein [Pyrinomonadaceae bacterium]